MPRRSLSSVRVISVDWTAVRSGLARWAEGLVREDPNVLGVLLYGSLARDDHVPGSDADLLVVVESSPHPSRERPEHLPSPLVPIPADVIVYTKRELRRFLGEGLPFLRRALREGRWLAVAPGWRLTDVTREGENAQVRGGGAAPDRR